MKNITAGETGKWINLRSDTQSCDLKASNLVTLHLITPGFSFSEAISSVLDSVH